MTIQHELSSILAGHGAHYAPRYQGFLSDHAPMAVLALKQLGAADSDTLAWYQRYVRKLDAADDSFLAERERYLAELSKHGIPAVLDAVLPRLISGWVKDAYHPIIRLAYGYQAGLAEEVAAGLAYFELCGACADIDSLATGATHDSSPADQLPDSMQEKASTLAAALDPSTTFSDRVKVLVATSGFADFAFTLNDNLRQISRLALRIFACSHDFFALHLVTGAHAFRMLYPHAGPHRDAVFTLGICAGYIAAGSPRWNEADEASELTLSQPASTEETDWLELIDEDEHNIKLACSTAAQAEYFADPAYTRAAVNYLRRQPDD